MDIRSIDGLTLYFDPAEQEAADLIGETCRQSIPLIENTWGVPTPKNCRVYVMTDPYQFIFHSAPRSWQILLRITYPLWSRRVNQFWDVSGGWAQRYGQRRAVGVKPPRLIAQADTRMGERIFIKQDDVNEKVRSITCHELTHAFTAHLKLPMWLNEGLAMVTVDKLMDKPTVRADTLDLLKNPPANTHPRSYRRLSVKNADAMAYHYALAYWLTRYLAETQPELLRSFLIQRHAHRTIERGISAAVGLSQTTFWPDINGVVVAYHQQTITNSQ